MTAFIYRESSLAREKFEAFVSAACFSRLPELFVGHRLNNFPLTVPPLPNIQKSMFLSHSFTARLRLKDYLNQTSLKSHVTGHFDLISAYLEVTVILCKGRFSGRS